MQPSSSPIIVDADALIALVDIQDSHAEHALALVTKLQEIEAPLIYPATTIVEATTALQRKLKKPTLVAQIIAGVNAHQFLIEPVEQSLIDEAAHLFQPHGSKKNTLFDAIVAAVAVRQKAQAIFSFDDWYDKQGFTLVSNLP